MAGLKTYPGFQKPWHWTQEIRPWLVICLAPMDFLGSIDLHSQGSRTLGAKPQAPQGYLATLRV